MKLFYRSLLALVSGMAVAGSAYASDIPPNNVSSDSLGNTAMGSGAMGVTTSGTNNTAAGFSALDSDNDGSSNTAVGASALTANNDGNDNTAVGYEALLLNNANNNTAVGYEALTNNTGGNYNTASGFDVLHNNSNGNQNSAAGIQAMYHNTNGNFNSAYGTDALFSNTTGSSNIAEGYKAGFNLTTGSNNIDIGSQGVAGDADMIKIGTEGTQTKTFIAGISAVGVSGGVPVVVGSSGQLGIASSSERFKTAITPMGSSTAKLNQLRPVTFQYKSDSQGAKQYGLIAEEVAKVYPELVVRDQQSRIISVRYDELAPMLLNEMQQTNAAQDAEIRDLKQQVAELQTLNRATQVALRELQGRH